MAGDGQIQPQTASSLPNKINSKPASKGAIYTCTDTGTDTKDPCKQRVDPLGPSLFLEMLQEPGTKAFLFGGPVTSRLHRGALDLYGECRQ